MPKVYISSTFEDLKRHREAVIRAVRALGHEVISMESYHATDQRPLDKCLADVRSCDAYVGIFAFRYGFIPPHQLKSITHLEYEECGKPHHAGRIKRLIFLLSEKADWPVFHIDADRRLVNALRTHLSIEHVRKEFTTIEGLSQEVGNSLRAEFPPVKTSAPNADLVPFLTNRGTQYDQLRSIFQTRSTQRSTAPILFFLHGDERQCHDMFLQVLLHRMQDYPGIRGSGTAASRFFVQMPKPYGSRKIESGDILHSLGASVLYEDAPPDEIARHLLEIDGPVLLDYQLLTSEWSREMEVTLATFLQFWDSWSAIARRQPVVICVAIKYELGTRASWIKRLTLKRANGKIEGWLNRLSPKQYSKLNCVVLERLTSIPRADVENWARSEWVRRLCRNRDLSARVRSIYEDAGELDGSGAIPMESLAEHLGRLLQGECRSQESY